MRTFVIVNYPAYFAEVLRRLKAASRLRAGALQRAGAQAGEVVQLQ